MVVSGLFVKLRYLNRHCIFFSHGATSSFHLEEHTVVVRSHLVAEKVKKCLGIFLAHGAPVMRRKKLLRDRGGNGRVFKDSFVRGVFCARNNGASRNVW